MNNSPSRARATVLSIATAVLVALFGGLVSAPAHAATTHSLTVHLQTPGGAPLTGIDVYAPAMRDGQQIFGDASAQGMWQRAVAVAGKPGSYRFSSLGDFDHTLYFATSTSTSFSQLLGGATTFDRAQVIPSGQSEISVSLASNTVISGVVKSPGGTLMAGATVRAYTYESGEWLPYTSVTTNALGKYSLANLSPGGFKLRFFSSNSRYAPAFAGGEALEDAAIYSLGVAGRATVDHRFATNTGGISGISRSTYGSSKVTFGVDKATVWAYPITSTYSNGNVRAVDFERGVASAPSKADGSWAVKNLAPGNYIVRVSPYYYNQPSSYLLRGGYTGTSWLAASIFTVRSNSTTAARQTTIRTVPEGGSTTVSVSVPDPEHFRVPIAGAIVRLQSADDANYYYQGLTSSTGSVRFGRVGTQNTIQPGRFELTVTTVDGSWEPFRSTVNIVPGATGHSVSLEEINPANGFVKAPTIAETDTTVGTTYTVAAQSQRPLATITYQWMRGSQPIYGATSATYTSRSGDIGSELSVRVRSNEFALATGYAIATVPGVITADGPAPLLEVEPRITPNDEVHVGTTLRAHPGRWSVDGLDFQYQWLRDGIEFENEGASYDVTLADLEHEFAVRVTPSKEGFAPAEPATSAPVSATFGPAVSALGPIVVERSTDTAPAGSARFNVETGDWTALEPAFSFVWSRGGVELATGPSYVEAATTANLAFPLEVTVNATAEGFENGSERAIARKGASPITAELAPSVTRGEATQLASSKVIFGETLTAQPGTWVHSSGEPGTISHSFQWYSAVGTTAPVAIRGATAATFTPRATDVAARLSVRITAHSTRYKDAASSVPAGTVVGASALTTTPPTLKVAGGTAPGDRLTVSSSAEWTQLGAAVSYQWLACTAATCSSSTPASSYSKIAGATTKTFVIPSTLAKKRVAVVLTATKVGFATARQYSTPILVSATGTLSLLSKPVVISNGAPAQSVPVGTEARLVLPKFTRDVPLTSKWQLCFSNCQARTATWVSPFPYPEEARVNIGTSHYGSGTSFVRVATTARKIGYRSVTTYSDAVPVVRGFASVSGPEVNYPQLNQAWIAKPRAVDNATSTIQWWVDGEAQAPGNSFVRKEADAGKHIYVVANYTMPGYEDFRSFTVVQRGSFNADGDLGAIQGDSFDDTITIENPRPFDLPDAPLADFTYSYHFVGAARHASTSPEYTPRPEDVGNDIYVTVYARSEIFGLWSAQGWSVKLLPGPAATATTAPAISWTGDLQPKTVVSIEAPVYSDASVTPSFEWQVRSSGGEWAAIDGATQGTLATRLVDAGKELRAVITGSKPGHSDSTYISDPVTILGGTPVTELTTSVLSGEARVGSELRVQTGSWSRGTTTSLQWLLNGSIIPGATRATYTPLAAHQGDEISVRVTGSKVGELDVTATTKSVTIAKGAAPLPRTQPTVTGTTTLTVTPGTWNQSGLTFTFQWLRNGEPLAGANNRSVALPAGATLSEMSVVVTATRYGFEEGSVTVSP